MCASDISLPDAEKRLIFYRIISKKAFTLKFVNAFLLYIYYNLCHIFIIKQNNMKLYLILLFLTIFVFTAKNA